MSKILADLKVVTDSVGAQHLYQAMIIQWDAPYNSNLKTYKFNMEENFLVPYLNLRRATDQDLVSREAAFVNRETDFAMLTSPSAILPQAMALLGPLCKFANWGLEGKIGDTKLKMKSARHPVTNTSQNNIRHNMMTLL